MSHTYNYIPRDEQPSISDAWVSCHDLTQGKKNTSLVLWYDHLQNRNHCQYNKFLTFYCNLSLSAHIHQYAILNSSYKIEIRARLKQKFVISQALCHCVSNLASVALIRTVSCYLSIWSHNNNIIPAIYDTMLEHPIPKLKLMDWEVGHTQYKAIPRFTRQSWDPQWTLHHCKTQVIIKKTIRISTCTRAWYTTTVGIAKYRVIITLIRKNNQQLGKQINSTVHGAKSQTFVLSFSDHHFFPSC